MMPVKPETLPISVVIASLGGRELEETIKGLRSASAVPEQIMICIPEHVQPEAQLQEDECLEVVWTPCRGQVAQRAYGLARIRNAYALQMDDDVSLPPDTFKDLFEILLAKGPGNVVAPFFCHQRNLKAITRIEKGFRGFVTDCYYTLICGAEFGSNRLGKIAPSGLGFGVPMSSGSERVVESEWLPGGVALCHKTDLIVDDYFPFKGKAFSEDLIHSILWRRRECRLWTALDVSALIDVSVESFVWASVLGRYKAFAYVAKMIDGCVWRTNLWFVFYCLFNGRQLILQNFLCRSEK